jgi:hypothetical protein
VFVALLPLLWQSLAASMASFLHQRSAWRLLPLLAGLLFAQGRRRTVTSWLRAGGLQDDFAGHYYFLGSLGRRHTLPAAILLRHALQLLPADGPLVFALDDTPTKRYGRKVQGAGVHRNPSPGPADAPYLYGHVWVTLSLLVTHPLWGPIALPLRALLYVRQKDLPRVPARYRWAFRTKLELAGDLLSWAAGMACFSGRRQEIVVDGAYAKKPFLRQAAQAGVVVISRLRRDAGLRSLPRPRRSGQRGRPAIYGSAAIRLTLRAGQGRGWQTVRVRQYREDRDKRLKSFEATWRPASGRIRVVLVQEGHSWLAYFSTDPAMTAEQVLTRAADRMAIEQTFHDLKEVEGLGQAQVRDIWSNVGVTELTLWQHTLVELWAWDQPKEALCDRSGSPWDDPERRPSHADRRKALQRRCLEQEYQRRCQEQTLLPEMQQFVKQLLQRVA